MMRKLLFILCLAAISMQAAAGNDSYTDKVQAYIARYKSLAIAEQQRSGVPAAITLAQGIHETMAGTSELATIANNHFGIKCKKDWTGDTFAHDDDAPQECFRKYSRAEDSYQDHSDYLKTSKRYASCFMLNPENYAGWAAELRKCGYATNPQYAQVLIKIIEDFHLEEYTYAAENRQAVPIIASTASPAAAVVMTERQNEIVPEKDAPKVWGRVTKENGIKGFWAHKGEVLLEYAIQNDVRYAKLLELNGLQDAPLAEDRFIYLEKGGTVLSQAPQQQAPPVAAAAIQEAKPAPADAYVATIKSAPAETVIEQAAIVKQEMPQAERPQPVNEQSVVIKDEPKHVAEVPVAEEVLQDAFSRMKAQMDRVVYAPKQKPVVAVSALSQPSPPAAERPSQVVYHTVGNGETAFGISKKYGITMKQLIDWNHLDFEAIKAGQKLRVK